MVSFARSALRTTRRSASTSSRTTHAIRRVEVYALRGPRPPSDYWTAHFVVPPGNELLVKLETESGISGFGLATSYSSLDPILKPIKDGEFVEKFLIGQDATR